MSRKEPQRQEDTKLHKGFFMAQKEPQRHESTRIYEGFFALFAKNFALFAVKKYYIFLLLIIISSCKDTNKYLDDSPVSGTIHISVDESFKPVIEEQIKMYEASWPQANIIAHYKPEASCLKDFFNDTLTRMVIITRGLTDKEEKYFLDSLKYTPPWNIIASDAIAIIVNANSQDTLFSLTRLQQQLKGQIKREQTIVFDGLNATSTVRYITDSILNGGKFDTSVVKAAKNSKEVLEYVSTHENAIGMIGVSWIGNPEDSNHINWLKKVKIGYVECSTCADSTFVKPMQESILTKRYPLVRGLHYAVKENYTGLGTGFINFMKHERGQLIFKRAYLGPVMGFGIRKVKINETLPKN